MRRRVWFSGPGAVPLKAVESIGKAVEIKTAVTGKSGNFSINDPVFQDERIRTSKSGLGQFIFRDGTKLAVGWGSSVVVDKFVFDGSNSVKKLTIRAAKGTFRWVSGKSRHTAYEILTPAGTIGVRGTAFDFYIGGDGTTAVVLLGGAASFCGAGGCRQLTKRCDYVVAKRNGSVTDARRVNRDIFRALGNARALPFLSGNQKLAASGGVGGCGLARAVDIRRDDITPRVLKQVRPTPNKPGTQSLTMINRARRDRATTMKDRATIVINRQNHDRPHDTSTGRATTTKGHAIITTGRATTTTDRVAQRTDRMTTTKGRTTITTDRNNHDRPPHGDRATSQTGRVNHNNRATPNSRVTTRTDRGDNGRQGKRQLTMRLAALLAADIGCRWIPPRQKVLDVTVCHLAGTSSFWAIPCEKCSVLREMRL